MKNLAVALPANNIFLIAALFTCITIMPSISHGQSGETNSVALQQQIENQQKQLDRQAEQLERQQNLLDKLSHRVEEKGKNPATQVDERYSEPPHRDAVGDMRSPAIHRGGFPGAIEITGSKGVPISLAIGGYVKTVAFYDTDYERDDPYFFPALLGLGSDDEDGQFGMSSELSRVFLDAQTDTGKGALRAYIEFDFRDDFTLRHAYLDWSGGYGQLKVGKYWSTFMDLHSLAEGVTEPLVSGAVLARQEQIRYTLPTYRGLTFAVALEDPSSNDIMTDQQPLAHSPDVVSTLKIDLPNQSHIRLGALVRRIELKSDALDDNKTTGWGLQTSGRWNLTAADSVVAGVAYGDGIGRYLLGLDPFSGAFIDTDSSKLKSRTGKGGFIAYSRRFSNDIRTNVMYGQANAEDEETLLAQAFESSTYFAANIFYEITPYLTLGVEYAWGERENLDGSNIENHRVTLGFQLF